jgi:xanthine dehydrogenase YagS FAD-binding subunit
MKTFEHYNAATVDEAAALLAAHPGEGALIAGGTDLMGGLRDDIWINRPKYIINLKSIGGLDYITPTDEGLKIGSLTTLTTIGESTLVQTDYPALAEAARRAASPLLRNLGTLAGNICQENRCWYYRYPHRLGGRIDCVRKGGQKCFAMSGDHRYHSIFGAVKKCIAVNPGDTAPALIALGATIQTTGRILAAEEFFSAQNGSKSTVLADDEIVTEIRLPKPKAGTRSAFKKIALRQTIDFAIINCAVAMTFNGKWPSSARICLNGVYTNPYRASEAEAALVKNIAPTPTTAMAVGELAVSRAKPLRDNYYKVHMAQVLAADTIMACVQQ